MTTEPNRVNATLYSCRKRKFTCTQIYKHNKQQNGIVTLRKKNASNIHSLNIDGNYYGRKRIIVNRYEIRKMPRERERRKKIIEEKTLK